MNGSAHTAPDGLGSSAEARAVSAQRIAAFGPVLVIGAGGLSCPALTALVRGGIAKWTLVDDDRVDLSNLHRQTLYSDGDVGRFKADVACERLVELAHGPLNCTVVRDRFTPDNALGLARSHSLILEGADNFATKFLAADAAKLAGVPIVQAGAVRFGGWALGSVPAAGACLRCVFEDIPRGMPETCAVTGVLGPVVGVLGALEALIATDLILDPAGAASVLFSYDARASRLRKRRVPRRVDCPLCTGQIRDLAFERYLVDCAA